MIFQNILVLFINICFLAGVSFDEWDIMRHELRLATVSSGDVSVDGSQTFSFSEPMVYELSFDDLDLKLDPKKTMCNGSDQVYLRSVQDFARKGEGDWCHLSFPGIVSINF